MFINLKLHEQSFDSNFDITKNFLEIIAEFNIPEKV